MDMSNLQLLAEVATSCISPLQEQITNEEAHPTMTPMVQPTQSILHVITKYIREFLRIRQVSYKSMTTICHQDNAMTLTHPISIPPGTCWEIDVPGVEYFKYVACNVNMLYQVFFTVQYVAQQQHVWVQLVKFAIVGLHTPVYLKKEQALMMTVTQPLRASVKQQLQYIFSKPVQVMYPTGYHVHVSGDQSCPVKQTPSLNMFPLIFHYTVLKQCHERIVVCIHSCETCGVEPYDPCQLRNFSLYFKHEDI